MKLLVFLFFMFALQLSACRDQTRSSAKPIQPDTVGVMLIDVCARSVVPLSALVERDGMTAHVFVVASETNNAGARIVKRVPVGIYELSQEAATLLTPMPVGSSIVISGAEHLTDGASVRVKPGL